MAVPKINDQFWFERSEEMVKQPYERINNSAEKLRNAILWLFGLFTASSVFAIEYHNLPIVWAFLFSLPYLVILIAYWLSLKVEISVRTMQSIIPENPESIRKAYYAILKSKQAKLDAARRSTLIAFILMAIILMLSFIIDKTSKGIDKTFDGNYYVTLEPDKKNEHLNIYANLPKDVPVLYSIKQSGDSLPEDIFQGPYDIGKCSNSCFLTIPIRKDVNTIEVKMGWQDNSTGNGYEITKTIKLDKDSK